MPIRNPNFSEAGSAPGLPRYWALSSFVRAERLAGFGPAPERGVEDFERWTSLRIALEQTERAFFDARPEGFEDFAEGFGTDSFTWRFGDARNERALFEGEPVEAFGQGFANDTFAMRWADVIAASVGFDGGSSEAFERGYRNDAYAWVLGSVLVTPARFGGRSAELFDATWPEHDTRGGDRGDHHG